VNHEIAAGTPGIPRIPFNLTPPFLQGLLALLTVLQLVTVSIADGMVPEPAQKVTLPDGRIVVVTEGSGEPRSIGSYSMRLYSGKNPQFPLDEFLGGVVRSRDGFVERLELDDLDDNGDPEVIVIIRSAGSGSYLSADAFSVSGRSIILIETLSGLQAKAEPRVELEKRIQSNKAAAREHNNAACRKMTEYQEQKLPQQKLSINQIREICIDYDMPELWTKIEQDPPQKPFQSDGCSLWFGSWQGRTLYPACFFHDLKYWAGYPGEEVERLIADAELMIDIACLLGSTTMAETMFHGTRLGGAEMYQRSFSWGFGRE
jgi:hypothetical protein